VHLLIFCNYSAFLNDSYLFFLIKKETKKIKASDNFGNNVRLNRYILESILTFKTVLNCMKHYRGQ